MGFKTVVENIGGFVNVLRALHVIGDEVCFNVTDEKMKTAVMDPAHVSLVNLELGKQFFAEYIVDGETSFTVNMIDFLKILKKARKYNTLSIVYDDKERKMNLTLIDEDNSIEKNITLHTLEKAEKIPPIPRVSFNAFARLYTDALVDAIEDCETVSDRVRININPGEVVLTGRGELGNIQNILRKGSVFEVNSDGETYATFSINYLGKIVKTIRSLTSETILRLSTNKPVKIEAQINPHILEYFVAPIIE